MELTKELIQRSKNWTTMTRVKDVLYSACDLLEHTFRIDAGYFLYYRQETNVGLEYSWGMQTPSYVLKSAAYDSDDFLPDLQANPGYWMSPEEAPGPWRAILRREGLVKAAGWLININSDVVGVFVLGRRTDTAASTDMITLSMAHICLMVEMIVYRRTAEQASLHDPLTGLLNRRGFTIEVDRFMKEQISQHRYMLVVLDLDELKQINDTLGHLAGDALLIQVGHLLQVKLKPHNGICARFGGDEFVVIVRLPSAPMEACEDIISSWFEDHDIHVSVGCAFFGSDGSDFESCFRVADERMYHRKSGLHS